MKNQKEFGLKMLALFKKQMQCCQCCGNERKEVPLSHLPVEGEGLKEFMPKGSKLLYCENCKEWGVLQAPESSF